MKKRLFALVLAFLMLCAFPVPALAVETTGSITASYSGGMVTFSGSVTGDVKAVAVLLFNPDGVQIAMTTCAVTSGGGFSGSIRIKLTSYGTYSVKAADYEGGAFFSEDTFILTEPSQPPTSQPWIPQPSVPITDFDSGESVTAADIERLVSEDKTLTVHGEDGAKLVFSTEALEGISKQATGSVKMEIANVSDEYRQSHPGKLVFSLTVRSGDKYITDFGGSVTVSLPYELKEGKTAENVTAWHLTASGVMIEIPCTYDTATGLASFTVSHFSLYIVGVAGKWENPFADVSESDWFYDAVRFVYENGLMVGTGDTAFSPQVNTSRGMIVTILYRLEKLPKTSAVNPFDDVAAGKWYTDAVAWAAENGIVSGYGDGMFGPEDAITREQMAVILMNYSKFKGYDVSMSADLSKYTDASSISSWAKDAISWANATALIQGDGAKLMPTGKAERCQVAAILQRFIENVVK
ncbi:MAG TPA: S-layer homology domain-containing protein [Clostridiaceae bacterium]|nr:S-layer homology domain-containing protein [Clostridiaceae bacterium]